MKRFLALLLVLLMLINIFSIGVFAVEADASCANGHTYGECVIVQHNSRQFTCEVCGNTSTFERMKLPADYSGRVYIEKNPSGVYFGSHNVADLLGLKDGSFTNGQVTVTINGTNISVSGTPTKNLYFDLQTGEFKTPDYLRNPGYTLPDGDYRFGLIGSGSVIPTACIRNADGVGNLISYAGVRNSLGLKGESFGIPYLYMTKNKAYDFSGNLILNLVTDKLYDTDIASTAKIEGTGIYDVSGYLWSNDEDALVFAELADRTLGKVTYVNGSKEYINFYLPREVGYLQIQMNLEHSASKNSHGWRLNMMYACDNQLSQIFPITNPGEYEAAIQLIDRPDFMGMGAHGSEQMTSFVMYIDGKEVSLSELSTTATDWKSIKIVRESDFYDPLDEVTLVATHTVIYEFDLEGLTVTQDVNWLIDETCVASYLMMFPVLRKNGETQITDRYFDDYSDTEYDVSESEFYNYPFSWTYGASKMTLYSEKSGIVATMESLDSTVLNGGGYKHVANSEQYNKMYFSICGVLGKKQEVKAGDAWHSQHRYEVSITKGTDIDHPSAGEHNYTSVITPPTCTEQGYTTYTCDCGHTYVDDYVEALNHSYGASEVISDHVRRLTCKLCGDTGKFERTKLPTDYSGRVYIENNPSDVYFGSHNVADLLGLKSGTYTDGQVTITIYGTSISVSGTPTKNIYFDVQNGTFGVPDYLRDPGYTLPDGDYRFGLVGDGSVIPTICIRNVDGVANLVAAVGTRRLIGMSSEDFGVPYLYLPKNRTYDFSGKLIFNMGLNTSYDSEAASTTKIEGTGIYEVSGYLWSADEDALVFTEIVDDKPATNHNYTAVTTLPTCAEQGYTTYTCDCGETYVGDYIEALSHNYSTVITPPTCTEEGYTTYTCDCGDTYVGDYVKALEHNYVDRGCTLCGARHTSAFSILDTRCNAVEVFTYEVGMTWTEWLNSEYNTGMGSAIAIWVGGGPDLLGTNFYMDIFVNGDPLNYNSTINEEDNFELIKY